MNTARLSARANEHCAQQRDGEQQETAMRNAAVQPGERDAFERPANRDPLVGERQRNGDGDEAQCGAGHERKPSEIACLRRFDAEQLAQQPGHDHRFSNRHDADDRTEATL